MSANKIRVVGARVHNLKNITVEIPRDKFVVITGLSGSGKSSLAFDTIFAEGQRRYVESLSAYARQFIGQMDKPDVDYIDGLSPAVSIDQKSTSHNPRSTVGTVTEIYDYMRLLEGLLMPDPEWRMQAADVYARHGVNPFTDVASLSAEVRRQVSPLTLLSSTTRRMQNDRMIMQAHRAMDMADSGEESALGLAKEFKAKYDLKTEEGRHNLWKDVRVAIYRGVTEHEMGHNMGLRHNFEGTIDSMNYFKKYWDLRIAANGGNKATLKQRFEVSPTQAEIDGKINEYQYSTVMDYGAKFNSDIQGLGKYDFAALKFAYGDLLEVFNETNPVNIGKIWTSPSTRASAGRPRWIRPAAP